MHSSKRLVMEAGWGSGLRDGSLETWSRPNKSKALDNVFRKRTNVATASKPKIHRCSSAAHATTVLVARWQTSD